MYKKYKNKPKTLSLHLNALAERLVPFLMIATAFVWLWK